METLRVLSALTCVRTSSYLVHSKADCLVCLFGESAETHGTCHEMLDNVLDGFYLVNADGVLSPSEEITDEDGRFFLVSQSAVCFEFLIISCAGGELQRGNCFWVPRMFDSVLSPVELTEVRQVVGCGG